MKKFDLTKMSLDELLTRFVDLSEQQGEALCDDDTGRYNRLFDRLLAIDTELRSRGPAARLVLTTLFDHPNPQVRKNAAVKIVALVPNEARAVLQRIEQSREQPFALHAGMALFRLNDEDCKPT